MLPTARSLRNQCHKFSITFIHIGLSHEPKTTNCGSTKFQMMVTAYVLCMGFATFTIPPAWPSFYLTGQCKDWPLVLKRIQSAALYTHPASADAQKYDQISSVHLERIELPVLRFFRKERTVPVPHSFEDWDDSFRCQAAHELSDAKPARLPPCACSSFCWPCVPLSSAPLHQPAWSPSATESRRDLPGAEPDRPQRLPWRSFPLKAWDPSSPCSEYHPSWEPGSLALSAAGPGTSGYEKCVVQAELCLKLFLMQAQSWVRRLCGHFCAGILRRCC